MASALADGCQPEGSQPGGPGSQGAASARLAAADQPPLADAGLMGCRSRRRGRVAPRETAHSRHDEGEDMSIDKSATTYVAGHRGLVGSAIWRRLEADGYTNLVGRTSSEVDLRN